MTAKYLLEIGKKHNVNSVDEAIDACEFVEELLKEIVIEMREEPPKGIVPQSILTFYADANWAVGDLAEEIELITIQND